MFDKDYLEKIRIEKEKWEEKLKESKERDVKFVTDSEIPIKRLYTPLDVKGDYLDSVIFLDKNLLHEGFIRACIAADYGR